MSYDKIPAGKDLPNNINVIIEISANSSPIKYEIDKDSDCLMVDRFTATPMFYPANYGYVPHTLCDDGDALDVLVITPYDLVPGCVIESRPIGVLHMSDESGVDAKIVAVAGSSLTKMYDNIKDISDLDVGIKNKIQHYFEHYKDLEANKWVKIDKWGNREEAFEEIKKSIEMHDSKK
jgi:inorganic pyrophosphatase